jgi:nitroreductase
MKTQEIIKLRVYKSDKKVSHVFLNRFSPRVFSDEEISNSDMKIILTAARFSPSSYNRQPWFFYIGKKGTSGFEKLSQILIEGNFWAKVAPVLILACYIENDEYGKNAYAQYDLGQAVSALVYQAQILGYYTHQMAGFDRNKAQKLVDKNHTPFVLIALGKIGDYEKASKKLVEMDKTPKERKEIWYQFI